jgi:hypothetical protein
MVRTYTYLPPVSYIPDDETHEIFHHPYQIYDILNGSGDYSSGYNSEQLAVDHVTGSGPLYDIDLIYSGAPHADSGITMIHVGDNLLMAETENPVPEPFFPCWYRYYIREILNDMGAESGRFRVEYIEDNCQGFTTGDQAPDQLCYNDEGTGGYGGTCNDTRIVVYRELNMPSTITD